MAAIKDMAEAHLRNVQQQITDLQTQRQRIEEDIQKLSDYFQQGVAELNSGNNVDSGEPSVEAEGSAPLFNATTNSEED